MATKDADGGNAATTRPAEKPSSQDTQVDKRLEPLEEFRSRAEGWMKEVTAQVARLASSFEHEDKKRQALENRLSDIEERIRSLLTLTELVSLDKNPFAGSPNASSQAGPAAPATTPAQTPSPAQPLQPAETPEAPAPFSRSLQRPSGEEEESASDPADPESAVAAQETTASATADEDDEGEGEKDLEPPVPAADRAGVEVIPVGPPNQAAPPEQAPSAPGDVLSPTAQDEEAAPEEAGTSHQELDSPGPEHDQQPGLAPKEQEDPENLADPPTAHAEDQPSPKEGQQEGQETAAREDNKECAEPETSETPSSPSSLPPGQDGQAKPLHAHHPNDAQAEPAHPAPEPAPRPAVQDAATRAKTSRRLLVVAWADLLAPAAGKIDVGRFTGFYEEAGWVDEETAHLVDRLVEEIAPHAKPVKKCDMRALHEATVQLLAEHEPELTTFDRVDDDPSEETPKHSADTKPRENDANRGPEGNKPGAGTKRKSPHTKGKKTDPKKKKASLKAS